MFLQLEAAVIALGQPRQIVVQDLRARSGDLFSLHAVKCHAELLSGVISERKAAHQFSRRRGDPHVSICVSSARLP